MSVLEQLDESHQFPKRSHGKLSGLLYLRFRRRSVDIRPDARDSHRGAVSQPDNELRPTAAEYLERPIVEGVMAARDRDAIWLLPALRLRGNLAVSAFGARA